MENMMLQELNELLENISYKTQSGILDFTTMEHLHILESELKKTKRYSDEFIIEFIKCVRENAYLLLEAESKAAAQAHKKGLEHAGYGYWTDKAGKVVAKTEGDKLITLSPKDAKIAKKSISSKGGETSEIPKKDIKKSLKPEKEKTKPNILEPGAMVDIKDTKNLIHTVDKIKKYLNGMPFENKDDKARVIRFLTLARDGDFSSLKKDAKVISKYIRVAKSTMPKMYIAVHAPNEFKADIKSRIKIPGISKELKNVLLHYGMMETAATVMTGGKESPVTKKMLSGAELFKGKGEVTEFPIKKTNNSISIGNYTMYNLKEPSFKELVESIIREIYTKHGSKNPKADAQLALRSIRKHNNLLMALKGPDGIGGNSLQLITPAPGYAPDSPKNREKIIGATVDKLSSKVKEVLQDNPSKEVAIVLNGLNNLKTTKNFETDSLTLLAMIAKTEELKAGAPDIAELFTYMRKLKDGYMAYLPAQSNLPLADVIAISPTKLTSKSSAKDIVNSMQAVFVEFDYLSVKKGAGGAGSFAPKIPYTAFKSSNTAKELKDLRETATTIFDEKNPDKALKYAYSIAKKHKIDVKEIIAGNAVNNSIAAVYDLYKGKVKQGSAIYKKQLQAYYVTGKIIEKLYNGDTDVQSFSNERYEGEGKMRLSITDGVNSISDIHFVFNSGNFGSETGKPANIYAAKFHPRESHE